MVSDVGAEEGALVAAGVKLGSLGIAGVRTEPHNEQVQVQEQEQDKEQEQEQEQQQEQEQEQEHFMKYAEQQIVDMAVFFTSHYLVLPFESLADPSGYNSKKNKH